MARCSLLSLLSPKDGWMDCEIIQSYQTRSHTYRNPTYTYVFPSLRDRDMYNSAYYTVLWTQSAVLHNESAQVPITSTIKLLSRLQKTSRESTAWTTSTEPTTIQSHSKECISTCVCTVYI